MRADNGDIANTARGLAGDRGDARGRDGLLHQLVERGAAGRAGLGALLHRRAGAAGRAPLPGRARPAQSRDRRALDGRLRRDVHRVPATRVLRLGVELLRAAPASAAPGGARARGLRRPLSGRVRPPGRVLRDRPQLDPPGRQPARHPPVRDRRQRGAGARGAVRPGGGGPRRCGGGGAAGGGRGVRGRRARRGRRHHLRPAGRGARLALLAPPSARGDRLGAVQAGARGATLVVVQHGCPERRHVGAALRLPRPAVRARRVRASGGAAARARQRARWPWSTPPAARSPPRFPSTARCHRGSAGESL